MRHVSLEKLGHICPNAGCICRISHTTMYKNIRFRWTRHLLTASIWCGLWGCWYGPSDAYFLYYDSLLPSTSTLLGAIVQSYTCVRHVNQWGPTKQYYMFSMDTEQNQPPRIPLEPSKMRFRSHLNVCNSLASHALPWPFTRYKINLLKLQALTSSDIDSRVMTYNGESRNFVYKEVLQ